MGSEFEESIHDLHKGDTFSIEESCHHLHKGDTFSIEESIHDLHKGDTFSKVYATYRPNYPQEIYDQMLAYHDVSRTLGRQLAVDLGCGTGQSTTPLTKYFDKVYGVDVSEDQIANMPQNVRNMSGIVAPAESLDFLEPGTVDLVTIGEALHWLNLEEVFQEIQRVLKPGGTFACYGYNLDVLENEQAQEYMIQIRQEMFEKYMVSSKTVLLDNQYRFVDFPFSHLKRIYDIAVKKALSLNDYMCYLNSFHFVKLYNKSNPHSDLMEKIKQRLANMTGASDNQVDNMDVKVYFKLNFFLILGRNV